MSQKNILVVEDEEDILSLIEYHLSNEGYTVSCAESGETGLELATQTIPDLMILDLMLPGLDGLTVLRHLKNDQKTSEIPVIILTAKGEDRDIVQGLELGADDYLTKPFNMNVLQARIKAVMRRSQTKPNDDEIVAIHNITVDSKRHIASVDNRPLDLTLTEFKILNCLARRPGWVFTRYQIVESTQGDEADVTDRSVDVHIVSLRKKLGQSGRLLETVRGVGYRMKEKE